MKPRRRRLTGIDDEKVEQSNPKRKKGEASKSFKPFARSYFEEVTSEAGLVLSEDHSEHHLTCELLVFLSKLENALRNNVDFPRNVSEFAKGFELWIEDDELLESLLVQNVCINKADDKSDDAPTSECVLRMLIRVECLQENLSASVMRRMLDFAISDLPERVRSLMKPFVLLDNMTAEPTLIEGLKEILKVSERGIRLEVITYLPDVISEQYHGSLAEDLCKLMTEDSELTPAILDCLSYFNLSSDLKSRVKDEMMTALRVAPPVQFFPNIINFFFVNHIGECDIDTVRGLREGLDWTNSRDLNNFDADSGQIMTILALKAALLKSKSLNAEWLKVISGVKTPEAHKPLDLIVLIVMFSLSPAKCKVVENIFKKRIKSLLFSHSLLNATMNDFKPVIREYVEKCLQLSKSLLICKNDPLVKEFGVKWIILMFEKLEDSRRAIISELIRQDSVDENELLSGCLTILLKIGNENVENLKPFSLQVLTLMDKIDVLDAYDVSRLMDLLCLLAFKVENSNLQDDIRMLIQKQLSSTNVSVKCRGISSGIMAVKHIACLKTEKEPIDEDDSMHYDDLPEGTVKEAASIIRLILKSTIRSPDVVCFFYDQLAEMLNECQYIDGRFLTWILNSFTNDFQNTYIVDIQSTDMEPVDGIKLTQQFCLDAEEEVTEPIGLNIAGIIFGENIEKANLQLLPSWFRVIQLLHKKAYDGKLLTVDALLGCAIVMPVVDDDIGLEEFNPIYFDKLLDCFVHCINWFRELLSAFATQDNLNMKKKILKRLNDLILLETKLCTCLSKISSVYQPPITTYDTNDLKSQMFVFKENKVKKNDKKPKNPKKKQKGNNADTLNETAQIQANISINTQSQNSSKYKLNTQFFRSIQFDVLHLLKEKLYIEDLDENESDAPKINMDSLLFLLNEINPKLSQIFPSKVSKNNPFKTTKSANVNICPIKTLNHCLTLLPKLCQHMELIAEYTHKIVEYNDGVKDALGLFTEQNAKAQFCLTGIFQMLLNIFSWIGFRSPENITRLKDGLKIMSFRNNSNNKMTSMKELLSETSKYVLRFKEYCLLVSAAANLLKFFEVLVNIIDDHSLYEKFMNVSLEMLSQSWRDAYGNLEKGLEFNQNINVLLGGYFSKPKIEKIKSISMELIQECPLLSKKNYVLDTFQCINKANFPLLFRSINRALCESTKNEIDKGLTDKQHLELWKDVFIILKVLTDILKTADNRTNLATFLKQSIPLLKLFLSQGMPMMNLKLRSDPDSVVEILKTLQHSTRFLHSLYCHSRLKKDTALIAYLPQMKLVLETLVYKVKESLAVNNCSEAFWMGNLKNKNLQGELIASQNSTQTEESDEEDQLPEDDENFSDQENDDLDMKSVSSVF